MYENYDFCGWATRNDLRCSDGRVIRKDAFKHNNGKKVPLVWNHMHDSPSNVIGHAYLEHRNEGVYAYGYFNHTPIAEDAKEGVRNGDIVALSICANKLQESGHDVLHGEIREVSLVLAGANPGAFIETVNLSHADGSDADYVIYTGMDIELAHADVNETKDSDKEDPKMAERTVKDVYDEFTDEQKLVVNALIGQALKDAGVNEEGDETMKHNVFDEETVETTDVLTHAEAMEIIKDAKRYGSMKESALAHGVDNLEYLFPDDRNVTSEPTFIDRDQTWVSKVMAGVHHTPYSRIRSVFADITADEARARGYIKGNYKKEEIFTLLKRVTGPTTVYKKQKLDRDDMIDIVDLDMVAMMKREMRGKLDEELARAYLIGDGRMSDSDDKIKEDCIRPIWTDDTRLFTVSAVIPKQTSEEARAKAFIRQAIKARKNYKGSGNPSLFTTEDMVTECLLLTDNTGRDLYEDEAKLCKKLRVKEIITVPVMEGATRTVEGEDRALLGLIVNLSDYNVGADKGGSVNMFEDFDIDYNAEKFLIETRCSGALIKPFAAIVVEEKLSVENG